MYAPLNLKQERHLLQPPWRYMYIRGTPFVYTEIMSTVFYLKQHPINNQWYPSLCSLQCITAQLSHWSPRCKQSRHVIGICLWPIKMQLGTFIKGAKCFQSDPWMAEGSPQMTKWHLALGSLPQLIICRPITKCLGLLSQFSLRIERLQVTWMSYLFSQLGGYDTLLEVYSQLLLYLYHFDESAVTCYP